VTNCEVEFENDDGLVGTSSSSSDDDSDEDELSGLLSEVTENSFVLNGRAITVVGSTLIDDSITFDQLSGELTLVDLLPTDIVIEVKVTADDVAIEIEDS
jgi:hypothetical protein